LVSEEIWEKRERNRSGAEVEAALQA
jgi:hypothetical protein